jgi:hypothetical protein
VVRPSTTRAPAQAGALAAERGARLTTLRPAPENGSFFANAMFGVRLTG